MIRFQAASIAFLAAAAAAAVIPVASIRSPSEQREAVNFPGWPMMFDSKPLKVLPLTAREQAFLRDFPGKTGRFSDGEREIIVRWVNAPTRMLHPAADCFRGIGYSIEPLPARKDREGRLMSCFRATRSGSDQSVCEIIIDANGATISDASAWFWTAMWGTSQGPWWSFVIAD